MDITLSNKWESGTVGFHQDLGRTGRIEWMFEASGGMIRERADYTPGNWGALFQGKLRLAFPF